MNQTTIDDKLIMSLLDINHVMRALYEGRGSQRRILMVLDELGGQITQRELTLRLGIQPGSFSEVAAKLENAGYITRTPSETDRRAINIPLTASGTAAAAEALAQRQQRHREMFACLSDSDKETLQTLLDKINLDWAQRYPGAAHGKVHGRKGE